MPADEFGLLKNVFGVEEQPAIAECPACAQEEPGEIQIIITDPMMARLQECTEVVEKEQYRAVERKRTDTEHAAMIRGDHSYQVKKYGPRIIKGPMDCTTEAIPPSPLIQLDKNRIVATRDVVRACYCEESRETIISLRGAQGAALELVVMKDPDRQIWRELEMAATHTILIKPREGISMAAYDSIDLPK